MIPMELVGRIHIKGNNVWAKTISWEPTKMMVLPGGIGGQYC
jgi:hypothetical protein